MLQVCTEPTCRAITDQGRCDQHRRTGRAGYGREWERTRAAYLAEHPTCECGCERTATIVHHLDGRGPLGPRGHDPANLCALSRSCHARVTVSAEGDGHVPRAITVASTALPQHHVPRTTEQVLRDYTKAKALRTGMTRAEFVAQLCEQATTEHVHLTLTTAPIRDHRG